MLGLVPGDEPAGGGDDPPPRDPEVPAAEEVADAPPGARRVPGLDRHLAVGDDLAGLQPAQHVEHPSLELRHACQHGRHE